MSTPATSQQPYAGDLEKTAILAELMSTPKDKRDEQWEQSFLANISQASFRCGDPQVVQGPDGFPYFQLFLPESGKAFQCFVLENMKNDFLLERGYGVVINPSANNADWVLSYGDIVNFHLNGEFYTHDSNFSKADADETIAEEEEILVAAPSETVLPSQTRFILSQYLQMNGHTSPKLVLMMRRDKKTNEMTQDIVFNCTPDNFPSEEHYRSAMQRLAWFLPRHYSYVGMDESTFGDGMSDL